jgi:hypothetical protein
MSGIVWLASYPKSGNTWLRVLLTNYLRDADEPADINNLVGGPIASARVWFDEWVGVEASMLPANIVDRLRPEVYRCLARDTDETLYMKVHDAWTLVDTGEPMFPADVTRGVVYIVRNPLDVAASAAHHWGASIDDAVARMAGAARDDAVSTPPALSDQLPQRFGSWSEHVRSWTQTSQLPVHIVRYEDLVANTAEAFRDIVRFCGLDVNDDLIRKAVTFSSFEELQRQEARDGFRERSVAAPGRFFRRGEVGAWQQELTSAQASRVRAEHGDTMRVHGYVA